MSFRTFYRSNTHIYLSTVLFSSDYALFGKTPGVGGCSITSLFHRRCDEAEPFVAADSHEGFRRVPDTNVPRAFLRRGSLANSIMRAYAGRPGSRPRPAVLRMPSQDSTNSGILSRAESLSEVAPDARLEILQAELQRIERRDWWLWVVAICVMLLLTAAVLSMNFPGLIAPGDSIFQQSLDQAVRGLVGLVLLFNLYSIYQQVTIKRTRKLLSEKLAEAKQFYRQATTDPLTGLANRRTAEESLGREMARARRRKSPLTAVAFDLNNFKQINDRYGHSAGDMILCAFAQKLLYRRRGEDMAVRMGGDEFVLLLPECPADQVPALLERMRPCEVNFQGVRLPVEFSSGVATYDAVETGAQFLERADQALYADKRARKAVRMIEPIVA